MSRLNAIANTLYYPTPLRMVAGIASLLHLPDAPTHILDHSCGTGEAVGFLAYLLNAARQTGGGSAVMPSVSGIELDSLRADEARRCLDTVLNASALSAHVPARRVGLLFSNPPYDGADGESGASRLELTFLKRYTPMLAPGGVLVHIIPVTQLANHAHFLARNYRDVAVWAFPSPEYAQFRQVIVVGVRHSQSAPDTATVAQLQSYADAPDSLPALPCPSLTEVTAAITGWGKAGSAWTLELARPRPRSIYNTPALVADNVPLYSMPPDPQPTQPFVITSGSYSQAEALREARSTGIWSSRSFRESVLPSAISHVTTHPLLPLRDEQAALLVSVGLLNNMTLEDGQQTVLVKGQLQKEYVTVETRTDERGNPTLLREKEIIRAYLTSLDLDSGAIAVIPPEGSHSFISRFRESIRAQMRASYPPLYTPGGAGDARTHQIEAGIGRLGRPPKGAQREAIVAAALSLLQQRGTFLSIEQGGGKSYVSMAAAYLAGMRRVIVVCPPHLVRKWVREVQLAVPSATPCIVTTITELDKACRNASPRSMLVVIVSRERLKLSHRWRGAALWQRPKGAKVDFLAPHCPRCGLLQADGDDMPLTIADLSRKKQRCPNCDEALWQAETTPRRIALAEYIKKRWSGFFDLAVLDEIHEYKGQDSAQGLAAATLAESCRRTLALTGTLGGGYSTNLFPLLWRFGQTIRNSYDIGDSLRWARTYGIIERITHIKEDKRDAIVAHGAMSDRRDRREVQHIERPGINPAVLLHMIPNTIFLRLSDVADDLPPYREHIVTVPLDETPDPALSDETVTVSHASAYARLEAQLYLAVREQLRAGSTRLLGALLQALLGWPDNPTCAEEVVDIRSGELIASAPALVSDHLYPKEAALVALYKKERARRRKMIVFVTNTESRDVTPRLSDILSNAGARVAVLKSNTVAPDKREGWVSEQVKRGADVLIAHPQIVATGLDLLDFPTLCFWQLVYSTYTMRQASRRSWRIGQKQNIDVYHFAYSDTLQERALYHIARKTQASQIIEGNLGGDGLVALADSESESSSLMLTLARAIAATTTEKRLSAETDGDPLAWQSLSLVDLVTSQPTAEVSRLDDTAVVTPTHAPLTLEEMRARLMGQPKAKSRSPRKASTDGATQLDLFDLLDRVLGG